MTAGLLPVTRGATRQGTPLVAISAPLTPWAVAQLHIRLVADEVSPRARAATTSWAALLADAGRKSIGPTGTADVRVTPDAVVVSFGVEAARADDALRAVDAALRARSNKPGSTAPTPPGQLAILDDVVGAEQARLAFPGQPISLPIDGGVLDAATSRALGDAVSADRVVVVVVAPYAGDALLTRMTRTVTAPLPKGATPTTATTPTTPTTATPTSTATGAALARTIVVRADPATPTNPTRSASTVTWTIPPRSDAGLLVLAALLGGRPVRSVTAAGIAVDVVASDRVALIRAEDDILDQVRRVASAPPPPEVVEAARARIATSRLQALTDPAKVAHATGLAALEGRPTRVEDEIASLSSTSPQNVSLAAASLFTASIVITRTPGPEPAPPPPLPTTTTKPPPTTKP